MARYNMSTEITKAGLTVTDVAAEMDRQGVETRHAWVDDDTIIASGRGGEAQVKDVIRDLVRARRRAEEAAAPARVGWTYGMGFEICSTRLVEGEIVDVDPHPAHPDLPLRVRVGEVKRSRGVLSTRTGTLLTATWTEV